MPGVNTPEGVVVPAAGDTYDYLGEQRRMANSQRTIVPVADRAAADVVASAMETDGRPVSDTNPLVVYNIANRTVEVKDAGGWRGAPSGVILNKTANQGANGVSDAYSDIIWEQEVWKTSDMTHAANAAEVTITRGGTYIAMAKVGVNIAGLRTSILFAVNGADVTPTLVNARSASGDYDKALTTYMFKFNAGDIIKVRARVNSTSPVYDAATCFFSLSRQVSA